MNSQLTIANQSLTLQRFPHLPSLNLQAWSAGDEYLLQYLEQNQLSNHKNILIFNDHFGALSCHLCTNNRVTHVSDSIIAQRALERNLEINKLTNVTMLSSLEQLPNSQQVDVIIMPLPKIKRMLHWQLYSIAAHYFDVPVIAVDKTNNIHSSTLKLFEQYLGETATSRAQKKHRLIFANPKNQSQTIQKSVKKSIHWSIPDYDLTLSNLPNVYSGEKLDLGARLLLEHLPTPSTEQANVVDLGCGNGVIGVRYKQLYPATEVYFVDESYMATESAKLNCAENLTNNNGCHFITNNCLDGFKSNTADIVLCNPPFHQHNAITDHIAWQMFNDAYSHLKIGGRLRVIGNRHLNYHTKLAKIFGQSQLRQVTQNKKFIIMDAIKK